MNSRPWLSVAVATLALAVACSSSKSDTTGGNGTGATGATGATGNGSGSSGGDSAGNTSSGSGGDGTHQDPIGTQCSQTGNGDYMSCSTSKDCQCPLLCGLDPVFGVPDAGGSVCVMPCTTNSKCPDLFTHCDPHGLCTTNVCEADAGPDDGFAFMGACNAAGTDDGTCEPEVDYYGDVFGACFQAGTASTTDAGCNVNFPAFSMVNAGNATRPTPSQLCPIGYQCVPDPQSVAGDCQELCDPSADTLSEHDAGACRNGQECVTLSSHTAFGGACTETGDGGCTIGSGGVELQKCFLNSDCECDRACKTDRGSEQGFCESPCTDTQNDCQDAGFLYTSCQRGYCNIDYCYQTFLGLYINPDAGTLAYGGPCNRISDAGDGLCDVYNVFDQQGNPVNSFGLCQPQGTQTVGQPCGVDPASGLAAAPFCVAGEQCADPGTGPVCLLTCDPLSASPGCQAGEGCFSLVPYPLFQAIGVCLSPCTTGGGNCFNSAECCDGFCNFDKDAGTGTCN